jgi:hypothetical protein
LSHYPVRLLAEKVETHAEFDVCREMGFHLFQGYFFCEPLIVRGTQASSSRLATLQLLRKLNDPEFSFEELAKLIGPCGSGQRQLPGCDRLGTQVPRGYRGIAVPIRSGELSLDVFADLIYHSRSPASGTALVNQAVGRP